MTRAAQGRIDRLSVKPALSSLKLKDTNKYSAPRLLIDAPYVNTYICLSGNSVLIDSLTI